MIGYQVSVRTLARLVNDRLPTTRNKDGNPRKNARRGWLIRAAAETRRIRSLGRYTEPHEGEFWQELKEIFAELQGDGKCAYCEQKLPLHKRNPTSHHARVTGDIEHYRPKNGVIDWPNSDNISAGGDAPDCYPCLAFHLRNYLLSCDICNRDFKRNYFPISGPRSVANSFKAADLRAEQPYLLHPLDPNEPDPEQLIEFHGLNPVPTRPMGTHEYKRAIVTIDLLGLTKGERFDLDKQRAQVIASVYLALKSSSHSDPVVQYILNSLHDDKLPHRNCARSFKRLYDTDPIMADSIAEEALKFTE